MCVVSSRGVFQKSEPISELDSFGEEGGNFGGDTPFNLREGVKVVQLCTGCPHPPVRGVSERGHKFN